MQMQMMKVEGTGILIGSIFLAKGQLSVPMVFIVFSRDSWG